MIYGIWDYETKDWVREMPSRVNDGGVAVLAFQSKREACKRAADHWACGYYSDAKRLGYCEVRPLAQGDKS